MSEGDGDDHFGASAVLGSTAALMRRDAPTLAGLAVLLLVLPQAVATAAVIHLSARVEGTAADVLAGVPVVTLWLADVAFKGAAISAALEGTAARPVPLGRALRRGLADYPANLLLMALVTLGITLGTALFILPGILLECRWLAALPAKIGEGRGARDAMARSRALSEGRRGTIFALVCAFAICDQGANWLAGRPSYGMGAAGGLAALAALAAVATLSAVISSVGSAAVYIELRRGQDGQPSADVAEAFA